jgi:hypothetical protein
VLVVGDRHRAIEDLAGLALAIVKECEDVAEGRTTHLCSAKGP